MKIFKLHLLIKTPYIFTGKFVNYKLQLKDPAVLLRISFHNNEQDSKWIQDNIEEIGTTITKGILKYFGILWKDEVNELREAVFYLSRKGVINSPEYWLQNAVKGKTINDEYAAILMQRVAALILE